VSGSSRVWRTVGAVAAAVLTQISKSNGSRENPNQPSKSTASETAIWRNPGGIAGSAHATHDNRVHDEESSPGQFGEGATRDLTAAEIRLLKPSYAPERDGDPDPGEVVWTWVPYVEHDGRGKDRPVLIIARISAGEWAACYLSTKQHQGFVSVGSGPWDSKGRESFLSPERVLRITEKGMRREATGLSRDVFDRAVQSVMRYHGLQ